MNKIKITAFLALLSICLGACSAPDEVSYLPAANIIGEVTNISDISETEETGSATETEITVTEFHDEITDEVMVKLNSMSMREKIYQMFIVTPECIEGNKGAVTEVNENTQRIISECPVGGVIFFDDNIISEEQLCLMTETYQKCSSDGNGIGMFIAVDEEGGEISRVDSKLDVNDIQDMYYYGQNADSDEAYEVGCTLAETIKKYGFNLDFAPVADIDLSSYNGLGYRCFGDTAETVSVMVDGVVRGLEDNGVCATLKHFPGIGSSNGDTHDGSVFLERTFEEMKENEFVPFKAGIEAGADFIMVSHVIVDGADETPLPADLSHNVVTGWLKDELGFEGIIITDAHTGMEAIEGFYSAGEAALMSFRAGADIVLMPSDIEEAYTAISDAVEHDSELQNTIDKSVIKILTLKYKMGLLN